MQHFAESLTPILFDAVIPFEVEGRDVAGRITRLDTVVDTILSRRDYPEPVARLLGEALAITALLGSIMKFEGVFTFQAKGDGPVSLLVCDFATPEGADQTDAIGGALRGMATFDTDKLPAGNGLSLKDLMGDGYLALTIDQGSHTDRYQGIVELAGDSLDASAAHYFQRSEQLPSALVTRCAPVQENGATRWRAGSILIQHLPPSKPGSQSPFEKHDEPEDWAHATALMETVSPQELLSGSLPLQDLLYRLYHEDGVRAFPPAHLALGCRCSREKLENVIRTFPDDDVAHMVVDGKISVVCQFCNTEYTFDPAEFGVAPRAPDDGSGAPEAGRQ